MARLQIASLKTLFRLSNPVGMSISWRILKLQLF